MKRIRPSLYAQALLTEISRRPSTSSATDIINKMLKVILKNGDWPRRDKIVRECERIMRIKDGKSLVEVESARTLNKQQKEMIAKYVGPKADIQEKISTQLVAGVRLTWDGQRELDLSLNKVLAKIFTKS